jgi:hypothetical protein
LVCAAGATPARAVDEVNGDPSPPAATVLVECYRVNAIISRCGGAVREAGGLRLAKGNRLSHLRADR